jgi:hypothetical protein
LRWFQAPKKWLIAALISVPLHTLAADVGKTALRSVAAGPPAEADWPELPVQPARDRTRAGRLPAERPRPARATG